MDENQLAKNIIYYRKKRGLSQEKVSEHIGVSRQAVTKWENDISRPSSDNLIKLAQLFEVSVDMLLGNEEYEKTPGATQITMGKMPWALMGISAVCVLGYVIYSARLDNFSIGTFICLFVLCVPIQLFLHIYFSNAINNNSFIGIAGFDNKIEYHICEVKKMLVQIDLHIGMMTTAYVFLLCVINCTDLNVKWLNSLLIMVYLLDFVITVEVINYKMIDKIYCREDDKKRAKHGIPITVIYTFVLFIGIVTVGLIFEIKEIENNTLPAMKICGVLLLAVVIVTIGFMIENKQIKKWNPAIENYKITKTSIISLLICAVLYVVLYII